MRVTPLYGGNRVIEGKDMRVDRKIGETIFSCYFGDYEVNKVEAKPYI